MTVKTLGSSSVPFVAIGTSVGTARGALASVNTASALVADLTFHGVGAGGAITTAVQQTGTGMGALGSLTVGLAGFPNTAHGWKALNSAVTAGACTAVGAGALQRNLASYQCAVGEMSMNAAVTPDQCVAVGPFTLYQAVNPSATALVGYKAGYALGDSTSGNTGIGNAVFLGDGTNRITGNENVAGGSHTCRYLTTASWLTIVGGDGAADPTNPVTTSNRLSGLGYKVFWGQTVQINDGVAVGANTQVLANYGIAIGSHATLGAKVAAGHDGSAAIGVSSAGVPALTTASNQIMLGVAAHTVTVPGALTVTGSSTLAAITTTTIGATSITASGTLGVTGATTLAAVTATTVSTTGQLSVNGNWLVSNGGIPKWATSGTNTTTPPAGASKWFKINDSAGTVYWLEGKLT